MDDAASNDSRNHRQLHPLTSYSNIIGYENSRIHNGHVFNTYHYTANEQPNTRGEVDGFWRRTERHRTNARGGVIHDWKSTKKYRKILKWLRLPDTQVGHNAARCVHVWKGTERYRKILEWLRASDPQVDHNAARRVYVEGTGSWLLESESYAAWRNTRGAHLWLHGKAGCGKTVLSSAIIEDLKLHCTSSVDAVLAFFYFTFSEEKQKSYDGFLASMVVQFCATDLMYRHLEAIWFQGNAPRRDRLEALLTFAIGQHQEVIIVLDAIDEITEDRDRELLLSRLTNLARDQPQLKIVVLSRYSPEIDEGFMAVRPWTVAISTHQVNLDIALYLQAEFSRSWKLRRWTPTMQSTVQRVFSQKANGM